MNNGKSDEEDEEMESWKSKRADDRMHKISFHALTKYVTLENMANSPIQNIKCFPNKYFPKENKYDFVCMDLFSLLQNLKKV